MQIVTKKISEKEYICYLRDENGKNLKAELGKTVTEATQKLIDKISVLKFYRFKNFYYIII